MTVIFVSIINYWKSVKMLNDKIMMYTWIIVLGVIILGIILYSRKNGSQIPSNESSSEILDRRFASGEISKEEYEEQKRTLNSKN